LGIVIEDKCVNWIIDMTHLEQFSYSG
jgi:hypothetical protein